jgi:hypothetical protein
VSSNKYELENKTPMDLFNYINNNLYIYKYPISQKSSKNFKSIMVKCDEDLFYNLLLKNKISNEYFEKRIKIIVKNDPDSLNCILSNYMCFLGMEKKKFYKKIIRKLPNTRKYVKENKFSTESISDCQIFYDESDFLCISKIKFLRNKIQNIKEILREEEMDPMISKDIIIKRKNLTNICDFEHIIKKLIENNNTIEKKFIEL